MYGSSPTTASLKLPNHLDLPDSRMKIRPGERGRGRESVEDEPWRPRCSSCINRKCLVWHCRGTSCTSCTSCTGTAVVRTGCSSPVGSSCPERGHRKAPQCNAGQRTKRKNAQNGENTTYCTDVYGDLTSWMTMIQPPRFLVALSFYPINPF